MRILQELAQARGFTHFVALTYNLNLGWFEHLLLRHLRANGVRHALILADERQLSQTLERQLPTLAGAGCQYVVEGVRAPGAFHPKLYLLSGPDAARLYVGSGNLTAGGLDRNLELFERWDVTRADTAVPAPFEAARRALVSLLHTLKRPLPPYAAQLVIAAFGMPVLTTKPLALAGDVALWVSPGAIFPHLPSPARPARQLQLVSPYFDEEGQQVVALARALRATSFEVLTDLAVTNLTPRGVKAIRGAGGQLRVLEMDRPLHAKALFAKGPGWSLGIHGSANLSRAAWHGHNAELVVVREGGAAHEVGQLLEGLQSRDLTAQDVAHLARVADARQETAEGEGVSPWTLDVRVVTARWTGHAHLQVELAGTGVQPTVVEVATDRLRRTCRFGAREEGPRRWLEVECAEGIARGRPLALRLGWPGGLEGSWVVVHDAVELRESARAPTREETRLADLWSEDPSDAYGNERLLQFLAEVWQGRAEREAAQAPQAAASPAPTISHAVDEAEAPEWLSIAEEAFHAGGEAVPETPTQGAPAGDEVHGAPRRLLHRLLFGDLEADASEGESALEEEDNAPAHSLGPSSRGGSEARASETFLQTTMDACRAYLAFLRTQGGQARGAPRLLEDALVLCACLQRPVRARHMRLNDYLYYAVTVLRGLLGGPAAPLPIALAQIPEAQRHDTWLSNAILPATALLLYNVCLADLEEGGSGATPHLDFPQVAPALWYRHVLRHAPRESMPALLEALERQLPRLQKHGDLWMADLWPHRTDTLPFEGFVHQLVGDVQALEALEAALRPEVAGLAAAARAELREDVGVVGFGQGLLASGFLERVDEDTAYGSKAPPLVAWLYTGSFQRADPGELSRFGRMQREAAAKQVPLEAMRRWVVGKPEALQQGLRLLARIAG